MSEVANALSMIVPLWTCGYLVRWPIDLRRGLYAAGISLVVANSFAYHSACSIGLAEGVLDRLRKLDQTSQHAANVMMAYAISESERYASVVGGYAAGAISLLWVKGAHDTRAVRRVNLFVTISMVAAAIAWRRDYANFARVFGTALAAIACFVRGNYYHALSHVLLGPYMYFLYNAIGSTDTS
jgi:hypothetical protein